MDLAPARFASIDTTHRCPLRCRHCYYYRVEPEGEDLPPGNFLEALRAWRESTAADCMLWLGGEPFLRPNVVVEGSRLFRRNAAFTSGLVSVPEDFPGGVAISLDGPAEANDSLRGRGMFQVALDRCDGGRDRLFHCTLTAGNLAAAGPLVDCLRRADAAGVLFGLYTPRVDEEGGFALSREDRDAAVDGLLTLREEHDGFVLNTPASLERMRWEETRITAARCPYRTGEAVALDHRLREKLPCSYGEGADCTRCGCVALFLGVAAADGDGASREVLRAFFRRR